jgi:hypothetical protein
LQRALTRWPPVRLRPFDEKAESGKSLRQRKQDFVVGAGDAGAVASFAMKGVSKLKKPPGDAERLGVFQLGR